MASPTRDADGSAPSLADLAELPEKNPGPVFRLGADGTIHLANAAARDFFDQGDLGGRGWLEICPGMHDDLWNRVTRGGEPVPLEVRVGGRTVAFTHVRSENGNVVFVYGADITERKHDEDLLAQQAAQLAELARFPEMNPGPVLRLDLDANVLLANAAANEVFGEQLLGRCWQRICPGADDAFWDVVLGTTAVVPLEARIGEHEYVFAHRHDPQTRLVFVFGADVSTQRRAERALRQSEKMATLGTLAAGVAHELNNPAAATRRAAEQLREAFARLEGAHLRLDEAGLTPEGREALRSLEHRARERAATPGDLTTLERSDREAEIEEWLEAHEVEEPWEVAPALVAQGLDPPALSALAEALHEEALAAALTWAASAFPVYALSHEIGQGSARISEIVGALKGYSYLGQAPVQAIDLHEGIDNTLVILRNKLKTGVEVRREYAGDVPTVPGYGGDLNQVWTNLIDNAVDAMDGKGTITIRTRREGPWAIVEIEDDGPGIPEGTVSRVFDPFFTTKEPGRRTGLGLSTSYSIVTERHQGRLDVESRPGSTRFTTRLPLDRPQDGVSA